MFARTLLPALMALGIAPALCAQGVLLPGGTPDPAHVDLHAWYDAASGPNSSATALPHGTAVTQWDDLSVNAFHLTRINTNTSRLPTVHDDPASCGVAMRFDGDDYIWTGARDPFGRIVGARTVFCVASIDEVNRGYLYDGTTSSGRTAIFAGQSSAPDNWQVFYSQLTPSGNNIIGGPLIQTKRFFVHTVVLDAGAQEYFQNGTSVASDTSAVAGDLGGFILGARVNTANGMKGYIREVLVYHATLSATDRQAIEGYLMGRHPMGYGEAYGAGCAGTGGLVPALDIGGFPSPGCSFDILLSDGLPSAPCAFLFAAGRTSVPLGPCTWLIDPFVFGINTSTDGAGAAILTIPIPAYITGTAMLTNQVLVIDGGAAPFGVSMSNALELVSQ